ncbi:MAG TPA: hypothetical protein VI488_00095 [Candidatus Angelobacter sp.]
MKHPTLSILWAAMVLTGVPAWSQGCETRDEIPAQAKTSMDSAAKKVFDQAASGDLGGMRANAGPLLQSGFDGVASAVNDNKAAFVGAHPELRTSFLLDTGSAPSEDGRYYCGVFGANGLGPNSAEFDIPGLPPGKYAIVIQDFIGGKGPYSLTTIFQDLSGWKLAGFYIYPESALGHDGIWYLQRAREYKAKGQNHNAWFYYVTSWDLLRPVKFMDSSLLSKIVQESNGIQPKDIPAGGNAVDYPANGKTYKITDISVLPTDKTLDLSIRYSVANTADFNATQIDAHNLANAYVTQHPELKDSFNNVWAHAVDGKGGDVAGIVVLKPAAKP